MAVNKGSRLQKRVKTHEFFRYTIHIKSVQIINKILQNDFLVSTNLKNGESFIHSGGVIHHPASKDSSLPLEIFRISFLYKRKLFIT
jgi:hypothetical protein